MRKDLRCCRCKKIKDLSEFSKDRSRSKGHTYSCKECVKEYSKRYKKRVKKYMKTYRQKNKLRKKKADKEYREKNKTKIEESSKKYYQKNKEKIKKHLKKYYQTHKKERLKYEKQKRKIDLGFRIGCYLRGRLYSAIKTTKKSKHTSELLGCSVEYLKYHLESQFQEGMSWNNWSRKGWHIDHIRPCANFDLSKESEQKKCFNYKNLQPLWAEENLRKAKK